MMTLNRYLLVGKEHKPWLVTLAKLEFKWVICGSLFISALINIGHGWQYEENEDSVLLFLYDSSYTQVNDGSYSDYPKANPEQAYFIYSIVYFVINFGFFFILNTILEVQIVRRMHKELKEKRKRMTIMNAAKSKSTELAKIYLTNKDKKKQEDVKKERKVIKMVVLNGIINFVLRAPDMLFWLENESVWSFIFTVQLDPSKTYDQKLPGILNFISDMGYFTYILTFITNFVIFYSFNKNFKEAVVFF
jgi:hypothetical protein